MPDAIDRFCPQPAGRADAVALRQSAGGTTAGVVRYADLRRQARGFAAAVAAEGPGAVVPLLLGKTPACVAAMLGVVAAGRAFACLNRKLRLPQIEAILGQIGPGLAVTDGPGVMAISAAAADSPTGKMRWRVLGGESLLPAHRKVVERLSGVLDIRYWDGPRDHIAAGAVGAAGASVRWQAAATDFSKPACCLFTSGSTGSPKGVLVSGADLAARACAEVEWFALGASDVLLNVLPFSFDVGLNQLLSCLAAGGELVLLDSWLPVDVLRASANHRVTGISGVPAIWADLLAADLAFDTTGPHASLRYLTVSGGDLPPQLLDRLPMLAAGVGIHKTYGQSEAFRSSGLRPEEFRLKSRSVGRPFQDVRVYVVCEDERRCGPGEEGEIVHTGLGVMLGYLGQGSDGGKLRPNPFRGVDDPSPVAVFTGDLGCLDDEGYLYVRGRRDGMVKVAGNRVYPAEVVTQLLAIPGVREAEVVGVKTRGGGTELVAFLVRSPGEPPTDLRRQIAARLPTYMAPRHVIDVAEIPRTVSGKPDRPALAARAELLFSNTKPLEAERKAPHVPQS